MSEIFEKPDFTDHTCDICDSVDVIYHLIGSNCGVDLCEKCYSKKPEELCEIDNNACGTCDICYQNVKGKAYNINYSALFCIKCIDNMHSGLVKSDDLIITDRGFLCKFKECDLYIPDILKDRILEKESFYELIESIVRPPTNHSNLAEWRLFSEFKNNTYIDAECAFAIRCVENNTQVASVLMDDHGRIAMNIIFQSVDEFINAENEWKNNFSETDRLKYVEEMNKQMEDNDECDEVDNLLIAKASDNFEVYSRLIRNLACYYG